MSFQKRNVLFVLFASAYVIVALYGNLTTSFREIFPIFSWSLFSNIPANASRLDVVITGIGDEQLEPAYYYDMGDEFRPAKARNASFFKAARRLMLAIESGDAELIDSIRRTFESNYLADQSHVRYKLVVTRSDPIERWRGQAPEIVEVIAEFETDE